MKVVLRVSPEQAAFINVEDTVVVANENDTYGSLKHHLCKFCEALPGFTGESHILFEKEENGSWRRLFNAMDLKEFHKESDIVYWKCISPEFLSQTQTTSKRKATEELPPPDQKKSKTDLEYEQRRTDFMTRLGETTEPNKIIPINTANVWRVIKIVHNRELNERHVVFPRTKLKVLTPYLQRSKIGTKIAKNLTPRDSDVVYIPIPSDYARADEDILADLELAQVTQYNYEIWHESLNSITISGLQGTTYPVVWPATIIPLSLTIIDSLLKSFGNKKSSSELTQLIELVNDTIEAEYGKRMQRHNQVSFFARLSTVSARDVASTKKGDQKGKELQIRNGEELVSLFLQSERIRTSLELFSRYDDPEKKMNLILVEWQDIEKQGEFRCFVYKEKLTAISQYFCYNNFGFTENDKQPIKEAIVNLWNQASLYIPYQDYVMDVYVDFSTNERLATIIEFNPFGGDLTSGSALYNWENDKHILYAEEEDILLGIEPEIRLLIEAEPEGMDELSASEREEEKSDDDDLADDLKMFKSKKFFK